MCLSIGQNSIQLGFQLFFELKFVLKFDWPWFDVERSNNQGQSLRSSHDWLALTRKTDVRVENSQLKSAQIGRNKPDRKLLTLFEKVRW